MEILLRGSNTYAQLNFSLLIILVWTTPSIYKMMQLSLFDKSKWFWSLTKSYKKFTNIVQNKYRSINYEIYMFS